MITEEKKNEIYKEAIFFYGTDKQLDMVIEEMAELTKEICKIKRGKIDKSNIIEEIADVQIMLEQLDKMLGGVYPMVELVKFEKLKRLESNLIRLQKEKKIL